VNEGSTRAILAAFLANLGIAIAKFVAFLFTGAASMLAESIPSMADTGNQALLALGGRRGRQAPTAAHPFGLGRERYFWAFLVAVVLFTLGSLFALFEGYEKLRHPHGIESPAWAFGALVVAIALESWSLRTAVHEADKVRAGLSWWAFIRRSKSPELPVVLLEDVGRCSGGAARRSGEPGGGHRRVPLRRGRERRDRAAARRHRADPGIEMRSLLIGEAASQAEVAAIGAALIDGPAVRRLIHLRTLHLGPDELLVGAKVEFDPALSLAEAAEAIDEAERRVRAMSRRRGSSTSSRTATGPERRSNDLGPGPLTPSQLGRSSTETALFLLDRPKALQRIAISTAFHPHCHNG
jgi:divalent metal cation (Fe/Co/Zn/Cd) transporter